MTLRPYTRANNRPYPRAARARHQHDRATRVRCCPVCAHPVGEHAIEGGNRVCSRGDGERISCRMCAEPWARMPVVAALQEFARVLSVPPRTEQRSGPVVLP